MSSQQKKLIYLILLGIALGLGAFWGYKNFLVSPTVVDTDGYSQMISQIQQLKSLNTKFNLSPLEGDDFIKLKKNGNIPVKPSSETGRSNPFSF